MPLLEYLLTGQNSVKPLIITTFSKQSKINNAALYIPHGKQYLQTAIRCSYRPQL
jgi:hypothetical protein